MGAGIIAAVHLWSGKQSNPLPCVCACVFMYEGETRRCVFANTFGVKFIIRTSCTPKPLKNAVT